MIAVCQAFGKTPDELDAQPANWFVLASEFALAQIKFQVEERRTPKTF